VAGGERALAAADRFCIAPQGLAAAIDRIQTAVNRLRGLRRP
jgi:hypothetical protein